MRFLLPFIFIVGTYLSKEVDNDLSSMKDEKHGIKMGEVYEGCDDAETDLEIDWDASPVSYTCYHPKFPYPINNKIKSEESCIELPSNYYVRIFILYENAEMSFAQPQHYCMFDKITYNTSIPTYGNHRPLWPVYGEYRYVPPQRWLHNIEHGAVVMLYHPCAHPEMVDKLRKIVVKCIRKHVITASRNLPMERPLALVTWGCKMLMNTVDKHKIIPFIKRTALHGPEGNYSAEGQYMKFLVNPASIPVGSDINDSVLCPNL
ncbi:DUF3105 domain containing protein-like protein [Leptotrombidium deliense]|uniref:DUF3105 domain containing protein-like protein n=1 Tax=Leptotrombidium deliense TaxID=299467 RepID=A0A443SAK6_9ACAR|nr:DUF3105 domain containing protein-like protein [Leptotrombidium deliense]